MRRTCGTSHGALNVKPDEQLVHGDGDEDEDDDDEDDDDDNI